MCSEAPAASSTSTSTALAPLRRHAAHGAAVEQQFGRSLTREQALSGEPFLAWALNGQPLTVHQGSPLRLIVPGWYGVANVKWLSNIHVQAEPYMGKFQTRWYRTLREETIGGVTMVCQ